jgi:protein-disulfide isomerase/uncharacterized membrane protein
MTARRVAILGGLTGALASAYLLVDYLGGSTICLTGSGCDVVRSSAFAYPLGIPLPAAGVAFYLAAVIALVALPGRRLVAIPMVRVLVVLSWLGVAVMTALTLIEVAVIHAICGWCLVSGLSSVVFAVGISAWARGEASRRLPPTGRSSRRDRDVVARLRAEERGIRRFAVGGGLLSAALLVVLLAIPAMVAGGPAPGADLGNEPGRPRLGNGPVQVVVFSDFECPACAAVAPWLEQLAADASATVIYRYFPLVAIHPNAAAAARAAQAAHEQGAFWAYHDRLFGSQTTWAKLSPAEAAAIFERIAADLGLDVVRWKHDLAQAGAPVEADRVIAQRLSLRGTPSIFIDGRPYSGRLMQSALAEAVQSASR